MKALPGDIITIQEIWQHSQGLANIGNVMEVSERVHKKGGGSATISTNDRIQILQKAQLNKDSHIMKLKYLNTYCWLANVYLNKCTFGKIQKLFAKLQSVVPDNEWGILCCVGDFNVNLSKESSEKELLVKLCKMMGLKIISPTKPTRKDAVLDFMLTGNRIKSKEVAVLDSLSDHRTVIWEIYIEANQKKKPLKIPCRSTANEISEFLIHDESISKAEDFIKKLGVLVKKKRRGT